MKSNATIRLFGTVCNSLIRKALPDKTVRKNIRHTYREIMNRAGDIGAGNLLLSSYTLAAFFIAMNRHTGLTAEENIEILQNGMEKSRLLKALLGDSQHYFSEKKMAARRKWSAQTHEHRYANDWEVDVLEKTDAYEFGLDYTACGVCKLCRDENCPELAKYLCRLDFMLVELIGVGLHRTTTLAEGGDTCDFRFIRKN